MRALIYIIIFIVLIFIDGIPGKFVENERATKALETQGYSDVTITDKSTFFISWNGCSSGDSAKFDVTATNPAGKKVKLFVCTAWIFKGSTIRTE